MFLKSLEYTVETYQRDHRTYFFAGHPFLRREEESVL